MSLDHKIPYYFENIRRRGFTQDRRKERKLLYTTSEYFKTLTTKDKKAVALVTKDKLTMRVVPGTRFFLPKTMYNERRTNLFKNATFIAKYNVRLILGFDFNEKSTYEFKLKKQTVSMTIWNFLIQFFRIFGTF